MRRKFIAGNWKMNKTIEEAKELAEEIKTELNEIDKVDIALFPPFTALYPVYEVIKDSNIALGAQNMWYESKGAYTGETSPAFIVDIGCKYIIIGHSERRKYFNETDELINRKIKTALEWKLTPIVCLGETLEQREKGETQKVIEHQFNHGFMDLDSVQASRTTIAYEPIWAIGTGQTATPEIAEQIHKFIRGLVQKEYGSQTADNFQILYGGSVKPENIDGLIQELDIDGALVGGASLNPKSFIDIVKKTSGG
ncbi:triose-phosphate isomerase [candidate division WOR-3 bacterium]|nr:triose-phosphate isomerase [candidate division WOR-3 bacterium]